MTEKDGKDIIEQTRDAYNTIAAHFSSSRYNSWEDWQPALQYVTPGDTVVDIGCGNGRLYQYLQEKQVNYIGLDQSDGLIGLAKEKYPEARFLVREMTQTGLESGCANVVLSMAAFHHLPTPELRLAGLEEMKRILAPGGHIALLNWNLYSDWARSKEFFGDENGDFYIPWRNAKRTIMTTRYYHGFLFEELHELAEQAGLKIITQYYMKRGEISSIGPGDNIFTVMVRADDPTPQ